MLKLLISAGTAIALAAAPTMAAAQSSAASAPVRADEIQPTAESVEGSALNGNWVLPLIGVVALIVLILVLSGDDDDEDVPQSP